MTRWLGYASTLIALLAAAPALATDFAVGVSPPHFELRGKAGEVVRDVLLMVNTADQFGSYQIRSADWSMNDRGGVTIHGPELQPGSCRPWVRIERRRVQLEPLGRRNYRFEVQIPPDAPDGECRFALLISKPPPEQPIGDIRPPSSIRMPIAARIAVIVYVAVGASRPELQLADALFMASGKSVGPALRLTNSGTAHGRPFGTFVATDAAGNRQEMIITPAPVLPGATIDVPLLPDPTLPEDMIRPLQPPVRITGTLEFEGGRLAIETVAGQSP